MHLGANSQVNLSPWRSFIFFKDAKIIFNISKNKMKELILLGGNTNNTNTCDFPKMSLMIEKADFLSVLFTFYPYLSSLHKSDFTCLN